MTGRIGCLGVRLGRGHEDAPVLVRLALALCSDTAVPVTDSTSVEDDASRVGAARLDSGVLNVAASGRSGDGRMICVVAADVAGAAAAVSVA